MWFLGFWVSKRPFMLSKSCLNDVQLRQYKLFLHQKLFLEEEPMKFNYFKIFTDAFINTILTFLKNHGSEEKWPCPKFSCCYPESCVSPRSTLLNGHCSRRRQGQFSEQRYRLIEHFLYSWSQKFSQKIRKIVWFWIWSRSFSEAIIRDFILENQCFPILTFENRHLLQQIVPAKPEMAKMQKSTGTVKSMLSELE